MSQKIIACTNYRVNPNNPSCAARGSKAMIAALTQKLALENIPIIVEESLCLGFCQVGPNLRLVPNGAFFHEVSDKELSLIIKETKLFLKQSP